MGARINLSLKEIAEKAGVSVVTVSRALNNNPVVKPETRARIERIIADHSPAPSLPPKFRTFTIVWEYAPEAAGGVTSQTIVQGATRRAGEIDASLIMELAPAEQFSPAKWDARESDGYLLCGVRFLPEFLNYVSCKPTVWLMQQGQHDFGDRIQPDHTAAGVLAFDYLQSRHCRRLCCISCRGRTKFPRYWQTRSEAFRNAALCSGINCNLIELDYRDNLYDTDAVKAAAAEAIKAILALPQRPDGIFVANALGDAVYSGLTAAGMVLGRDYDFVAGDKELCSGYYAGTPAKLDIQAQKIGETAINALLWRIENPLMAPVTYQIRPELFFS